MRTLSTQLELLRAIREQPDDDTLRLVYADYLDELDTVNVPWDCKRGCGLYHADCCSLAGGTGFVPDTSNRDRAELIRVQVELATYGSPVPNTDRVCELAHREHDLLKANSARWRKGPVCEECGGFGFTRENCGGLGTEQVKCPDCFGTGDAGGLMRRVWIDGGELNDELGFSHEVTYHRGMARVHCRAEAVWEWPSEGEVAALGDGGCRPTAWTESVCLWHPDVVEFELTDSGGVIPDGVLDLCRIEGGVLSKDRKANGIVRWVHTFLKDR